MSEPGQKCENNAVFEHKYALKLFIAYEKHILAISALGKIQILQISSKNSFITSTPGIIGKFSHAFYNNFRQIFHTQGHLRLKKKLASQLVTKIRCLVGICRIQEVVILLKKPPFLIPGLQSARRPRELRDEGRKDLLLQGEHGQERKGFRSFFRIKNWLWW